MEEELNDLNHLNEPTFASGLRCGSRSAYCELEEALFPWFRNFLIDRYELGIEDAKDIVRDAAYKIVYKIKTYNSSKGKFVSWAFQILRNCCADWLRKNKRCQVISIDELPDELSNDLAYELEDCEEDVPPDDLSPLEKLPQDVRQAILSLNPRYQQFIGLMLLGTPDVEIMKRMSLGTSESYRTLKSRALSKLKEKINTCKKTCETKYDQLRR